MSDIVPLLESLPQAQTLKQIERFFSPFIEPLGFYAFTLGSAPLRKGQVDSSGVELYSTLPEPFQDAYRVRQMERVDPVFEIVARRFLPFTKSSIVELIESTPHKGEVNRLAEEHEIGEALLIPFNTADYARAVVLLTKLSPSEVANRIRNDSPVLHAAALAVMGRAVEIGFGLAPVEGVHLTNRERDCLHLCAQGATQEEIARSLGVAERTVRFHLGNSYQKLGVRSSSEAVARAIQLGLIRT